MGLRREYLDYIETCIADVFGDMRGPTMLELGDQTILADSPIPETTGKEYFQNRGVLHTSIDLNGRHGALRLDLARPIQWFGCFDIITNSGTTEHVEPHQAQYECFQNIHNLLSVGGIVIHLVPDIRELERHGAWRDHCCNYYSHEFFQMLAVQNTYRLMSSRIIRGLRCVCLQKTARVPFMQNRKLFLSMIARRRGGITYPGINDSRLVRLFRRAHKLLWG